MTVVVDVHEPPEIRNALKKVCKDVREEPLETGDFLVRGYIIERKEYSDYVGRLQGNENDIFIQVLSMVNAADEHGLEPEILLEGDWQQGLIHSNMPKKYIVATMAGLRKMGCSFFHTYDVESTARYLATLEKDKAKADPGKIRDTPSVPPDMMALYLTQGFNNVGEKTARDLLDHFGSFRAIVDADPEDLQAVKGVGQKTAEGITRDVNMGLPA